MYNIRDLYLHSYLSKRRGIDKNAEGTGSNYIGFQIFMNGIV
jgi:hypothetical protein